MGPTLQLVEVSLNSRTTLTKCNAVWSIEYSLANRLGQKIRK